MGLGLIFVPLTNASMAELPNRKLAQGTGLFNVMRQLGGSLGITIMATLLSRYAKAEKAVLTEHVKIYLLSGIVLVCALPLLLWNTGRARMDVDPAH